MATHVENKWRETHVRAMFHPSEAPLNESAASLDPACGSASEMCVHCH